MFISRLEIAYPYLFERVLFFDILLVADLIVVAASLFLLYSLIPVRMLKRTEKQALMLVRFYGLCTED